VSDGADRERRKARLLGSLGVAGTVSASGTALAATPTAASPALAATLGMSLSTKALVTLGSAVLAIGASYGAASLTTDPAMTPSAAEAGRSHSATPPGTELWLDPPMPMLGDDDDALDDMDDAVHDAVAASPPSTTEAPRAPLSRAAAPTPDILADEAALIDRSRLALRDGDAGAALRALAEHARRHPTGMLAEEREVQRVRAYCALGDEASAAQVAARFVREHPTSLHAAAMASPCEP